MRFSKRPDLRPAPDPGGPGPRPELAWLPLDLLDVDRRYQRGLDGRRSELLISNIAGNFRWAMFQSILVTASGTRPGRWLIIDGQHRVQGAKGAGIAEVPAVIVAAESVAEQAAAFVGANQARVAVNPYALYHARLTAGDADALAVAAFCNKARITIPRSPVPADRMKPGETVALGAVTALPRRYGPVIAGLAIGAVADAYRDFPGGLRANFFHAAALLLKEQPSGAAAATAARITAALRAIGWGQLEQLSQSRKARYGGTLVLACVAVIKVKLPSAASAGVPMARLMAGR
jgi:hypothetical protein